VLIVALASPAHAGDYILYRLPNGNVVYLPANDPLWGASMEIAGGNVPTRVAHGNWGGDLGGVRPGRLRLPASACPYDLNIICEAAIPTPAWRGGRPSTLQQLARFFGRPQLGPNGTLGIDMVVRGPDPTRPWVIAYENGSELGLRFTPRELKPIPEWRWQVLREMKAPSVWTRPIKIPGPIKTGIKYTNAAGEVVLIPAAATIGQETATEWLDAADGNLHTGHTARLDALADASRDGFTVEESILYWFVTIVKGVPRTVGKGVDAVTPTPVKNGLDRINIIAALLELSHANAVGNSWDNGNKPRAPKDHYLKCPDKE
jgi:hypothetical protein